MVTNTLYRKIEKKQITYVMILILIWLISTELIRLPSPTGVTE